MKQNKKRVINEKVMNKIITESINNYLLEEGLFNDFIGGESGFMGKLRGAKNLFNIAKGAWNGESEGNIASRMSGKNACYVYYKQALADTNFLYQIDQKGYEFFVQYLKTLHDSIDGNQDDVKIEKVIENIEGSVSNIGKAITNMRNVKYEERARYIKAYARFKTSVYSFLTVYRNTIGLTDKTTSNDNK